jgi:hypothetical protein
MVGITFQIYFYIYFSCYKSLIEYREAVFYKVSIQPPPNRYVAVVVEKNRSALEPQIFQLILLTRPDAEQLVRVAIVQS